MAVTAVAVASMALCVAKARAQDSAPVAPNFLLFAGTDLWRYGGFLYGGMLWSPAGFNSDGFTLKTLLNGGRYSYSAGDLHGDVGGTTIAAAALPGWRFSRDGLTVSLFAGPVVQDYRLAPYDPGSRLHGLYVGGQFSSEVWYQPNVSTMVAVNGSLASIGPTGSVRAAVGYRVFDAMFVGPETAALWCGDFQQFQFGVHVTALRLNVLEWSAGSGWSMDSDRRAGPYLRLGLSARY
jgi:hypothetical protein